MMKYDLLSCKEIGILPFFWIKKCKIIRENKNVLYLRGVN